MNASRTDSASPPSLFFRLADKSRSDAIRFYESLGFVPSHEGFKMRLDKDS